MHIFSWDLETLTTALWQARSCTALWCNLVVIYICPGPWLAIHFTFSSTPLLILPNSFTPKPSHRGYRLSPGGMSHISWGTVQIWRQRRFFFREESGGEIRAQGTFFFGLRWARMWMFCTHSQFITIATPFKISVPGLVILSWVTLLH